MTVESTINKSGPYAGAGSVGPYTVGFRFLDQTHLRVIKTVGIVDSNLVLATDYSVAGVGNPTGSVTLVAPLATGEKLTIIRNVPATQEADYVQNDAFPAESHEEALDKLTMLVQQQQERLDRSLTIPASVSSSTSTELPFPESNKLIGWNQAADALQNVDPVTLATIVAFGTAKADLFSGAPPQTAFALTANPGAIGSLDVSIAGVTQRAGIDFFWAGGTTLTFAVAPPVGTNNVLARYMQGLPQGATDADAVFIDGGSLTAFMKSKNLRVVDSIAGLRTLSKSSFTRAFVAGYYAAGDGGGGAYWYDSSDVATADNGGTIIVASDGARWKLIHTGTVYAEQFGALGNDAFNNTARLQAAINASIGKTLLLGDGIFRINNVLNVPTSVTIRGSSQPNCIIRQTDATKGHFAIPVGAGLLSEVHLSQFTLDATVQINPGIFAIDATALSGGGLHTSSISKITMSNNIASGIRVQACLYMYITDVTINSVGQGGAAILLQGRDTVSRVIEVYITNFLARSGTHGPTTYGLYIGSYTEGVYVNGAQFASAGIDVGVNIVNDLASPRSPENLWFHRVVCDTNFVSGLQISAAYSANFVDCWFAGAQTSHGVLIVGGTDITFSACRVHNNAKDGFRIADPASFITINGGCAIFDNAISSHNNFSGVSILPGCSNFAITDNRFSRTGASNYQQYSVVVFFGASDRYIISNNNLFGYMTAGILDGGSGVNKFVGNNIT